MQDAQGLLGASQHAVAAAPPSSPAQGEARTLLSQLPRALSYAPPPLPTSFSTAAVLVGETGMAARKKGRSPVAHCESRLLSARQLRPRSNRPVTTTRGSPAP
jgi:hypothetical protein